MSMKSQTANMRSLAVLLEHDLGSIPGARETGPNGAKSVFLHTGKVFLRALAKDLGLRDARVTSNAAGFGVSGSCTLSGMWDNGGLYICLEQFFGGSRNVMLYRTIRDGHDHKGGHNHFLRVDDLRKYSYEELLRELSSLRKDGASYERAA